jgi:hypothetical protein
MRPTLADLADAMSEARHRLEAALPGQAVAARPVAIGWVTVETERAERELTEAFGAALGAFVDAPNDLILGAKCRTAAGGPAGILAILEPATEGRLAETLARLGEGPAIVWFTVEAPSGDRTAAPSAGPFGRERLVDRHVRDGRHVLLLEGEPGTIAT